MSAYNYESAMVRLRINRIQITMSPNSHATTPTKRPPTFNLKVNRLVVTTFKFHLTECELQSVQIELFSRKSKTLNSTLSVHNHKVHTNKFHLVKVKGQTGKVVIELFKLAKGKIEMNEERK